MRYRWLGELVGTGSPPLSSLEVVGKVVLGTLLVGMLVVASWRSSGGWGLETGKMLGFSAPVTGFMVIAATQLG